MAEGVTLLPLKSQVTLIQLAGLLTVRTMSTPPALTTRFGVTADNPVFATTVNERKI